jgi:hypothetical protein
MAADNVKHRFIETNDTWGIGRGRMAEIEPSVLLPIRLFHMHHAQHHGQGAVMGKEQETEGAGPGRVLGVCLTTGIIGHAQEIERDGIATGRLADVEPVNVKPRAMWEAVRARRSEARRWVPTTNVTIEPYKPVGEHQKKVVRAYKNNAPLTVYTSQAIKEVGMVRAVNFWTMVYRDLDKIKCHHGLYGILHDNAIVSMGPLAGADMEPNLEGRRPHPGHRGFLDACFAPQSTASGSARLMVAGVTIRFPTDKLFENVRKIIDCFSLAPDDVHDGEKWTIKCMGVYMVAYKQEVMHALKMWSRMEGREMPTMHAFVKEKLLVISVAMGTLVRPLVVDPVAEDFVGKGPMIDTTIAHGHCDTLSMLRLRFPDISTDPDQFFSACVLTIPFYAWTTEPRLNLGLQMLRQALSRSPVQGDFTAIKPYAEPPCVTTPFGMRIISTVHNREDMSMPHIMAVAAFINVWENTEDACVVSTSFSNSPHMMWKAYVDYPLPSDEPMRNVIENITSRPYWKPDVEGECMRVFMTTDKQPFARTFVACDKLKRGDKLATQHGLKFTVGAIMDDEKMVLLMDTDTKEMFKADILLSTKNMARGMGGQLREMAAAMSVYPTVADFRNRPAQMRAEGKLSSTVTVEDRVAVMDPATTIGLKPIIRTAMILDPVTSEPITMKNAKGEIVNMRCSYGIVQIMRLKQVAAMKAHYPAEPIKSMMVPKGRYKSGTPRLGEGEILAMHMANLHNCISDALITADLVTTEICMDCRAMAIFCDCRMANSADRVVLVNMRRGLVMLNTFVTLSTCSGRTPHTLRFSTLSA